MASVFSRQGPGDRPAAPSKDNLAIGSKRSLDAGSISRISRAVTCRVARPLPQEISSGPHLRAQELARASGGTA